jgi:hypothetical protein
MNSEGAISPEANALTRGAGGMVIYFVAGEFWLWLSI